MKIIEARNKQRKVTKESIANFHLLRRHFSKIWWYMSDSQLLVVRDRKVTGNSSHLPTKQIPEQLGLDSETCQKIKLNQTKKLRLVLIFSLKRQFQQKFFFWLWEHCNAQIGNLSISAQITSEKFV